LINNDIVQKTTPDLGGKGLSQKHVEEKKAAKGKGSRLRETKKKGPSSREKNVTFPKRARVRKEREGFSQRTRNLWGEKKERGFTL